MSRYFECKSNKGTIQINDTNPLLVLKRKYKLKDYFRISTNNFSFVDFHGQRITTNAFFYDLQEYEGLTYIGNPYEQESYVFTNTGRQLSYNYNKDFGNKRFICIANTTKEQANNFTVYEYGLLDNIVSNKANLECYDKNGRVVFSDVLKQYRVLGGYRNQFCPFLWAGNASGAHPSHNNTGIRIRLSQYYGYGFDYTPVKYTYNNKQIAYWCHLPFRGGGGSDYMNYIKTSYAILSNKSITLTCTADCFFEGFGDRIDNDPYNSLSNTVAQFVSCYSLSSVVDVTNF